MSPDNDVNDLKYNYLSIFFICIPMGFETGIGSTQP